MSASVVVADELKVGAAMLAVAPSLVCLEIDAYSGADGRVLRALASSERVEEDGKEDSRWVAYAGRQSRGRVRIRTSALATGAITLERVTVEWYGKESIAKVSGEEGACKILERLVARSPPREIARAVVINQFETVALQFGIDLPPGLAPSFSGDCSKYWYRVVVKVVTTAENCVEVTVPISLRSNGVHKHRDDEDSIDYGESDMNWLTKPAPRNFTAQWIHVEDSAPPESPRFSCGPALTQLQVWGDSATSIPREYNFGGGTLSSPPKTPNSMSGRHQKSKMYVVSMGEERLMKVTIRKASLSLATGSDVSGILDFTCAKSSATRVRSVMITLESEEIIHAERNADGQSRVFRKIWIETSEQVEHLDKTNFFITLPLSCPGNFRTSNVQLKWFLRFDITSVTKTPAGEFAVFFRGEKDRKDYRRLEWNLPLNFCSENFTGFEF